MAGSSPPSYEFATTPSPNQHLSDTERYILVLDHCAIYPADPPSRILYELSNPPLSASTSVYGIEKVRYRLVPSDDGGNDEPGMSTALKSRLDHIYDFKDQIFQSGIRTSVVLHGKSSTKRTYKEVKLSPGLAGWSTCAAKGHFKAVEAPVRERILGSRGKKCGQILWKTAQGVVIAAESRVSRDDENAVLLLPRLEIRVAMSVKDLDLLVACWTARLWKEAKHNLKVPFNWQDFKTVASQKRRFGTTPVLSGGLGVSGASIAF